MSAFVEVIERLSDEVLRLKTINTELLVALKNARRYISPLVSEREQTNIAIAHAEQE